MFKSFGTKEKIILGIVILCFLGLNVKYYYRQKSNTNEFLVNEFSGIVSDIKYENRVNKITLENGEYLAGNLEMYDAVNSEFQNKNFEEFISPGDSVFKSAKSGDLNVYPKHGNPFVVGVGYYRGD